MFFETCYVFFIVLADVLAAYWMIPLPLGLAVEAGVLAIAPIFTLRDVIHRTRGPRYASWLIVVASVISYLVSLLTGNAALGRVTIASVLAFFVSENVDTVVYHLLRRATFMRRVLLSNAFSAAVDSVLFISIAFGFAANIIIGQYVIKILIAWLTALVVRRAWRGTDVDHALVL